jgi:hypothetical protein
VAWALALAEIDFGFVFSFSPAGLIRVILQSLAALNFVLPLFVTAIPYHK